MRLQTTLAAAGALTVLALAGRAHAQAKDEPIYYRFEDDSLVGDTLATTPPLLTIRPRIGHVTLIRPRASFVAEMLQSVERL